MKKQKLKIALLSLFFLLFIGCGNLEEDYNLPQYENSIKIGVVGDVSVLREQVENMFFGAKLASEEINAKQGVEINNTNYYIELIYKNSGGSVEKGLQVTQELIDLGVDIIVGPTFSSVAIEIAELCIEKDVLMMTYAATTPEITMLDDNDLIWRTCPSDYTFGTISAQYCRDSLGFQSSSVFYRNDRFGKGLSDIIRESFQGLNGDVSNFVSYPGDIPDLKTYDFSYEMSTLLSQNVDVIFMIAFSDEIAILTNELYNNELYQKLEKKPALFLNDGVIPEDLIVNGNPELLETVIGITSTNTDNPNYNKYKANYINRFGFAPSTYSEQAYDAIYCIAYAILRANSDDPNDIKLYLREISGSALPDQNLNEERLLINVNEFGVAKNLIGKGELINYEGASGPINFDENGDPLPKIVIWEIENNKYQEITYYGK